MKKNFASAATIAALVLTTALTTTSAFAQSAYPQDAPPPSVLNPANANYNAPAGYYGTPMSQGGIEAVASRGPTTPLYYARKGFTEAALPDGERVGVEFNLDPNGYAYFSQAFDLNNPNELERWNETINADVEQNANTQAMYESHRWNGPGFYFGAFNPCWGRERNFALMVEIDRRGVIFADPYRLEVGFPIIVEPVFGFGFGRGLAQFERERAIELERARFHERFGNFYGQHFPGREVPFRGPEIRRDFPNGRQGTGFPPPGQPRIEQRREPVVAPVPHLNPPANGNQQNDRGRGRDGGREGGRDNGRQAGSFPERHHG